MGRQFKFYLEPPSDKSGKAERSRSNSSPHMRHNSQSATTQQQDEQPAEKTIYACKQCLSHLALASQLISKSFHGKTGSAFLFNDVANVFLGPESTKEMMTGKHVVCDIYCNECACIIGWTYIKAYQEDQKYKEGKFIIEKAYMRKISDKIYPTSDEASYGSQEGVTSSWRTRLGLLRPGTARSSALPEIGITESEHDSSLPNRYRLAFLRRIQNQEQEESDEAISL